MVGEPVGGAPEHHREHGFANPSGLTGTSPVEFLIDRSRLALGLPQREPAPVLSPDEAAAGWAASGSADAVQWLGHASLRIRLSGVVVVVDPVFGSHVTPLPPIGPPRAHAPPVGAADLAGSAAVLISHNHYDHFEPHTLDAIAASGGTDCLLPLRASEGRALACRVVALDWHQSARFAGVTATFLPAQHESGRGLFDRDRSLWGAWLIEGPNRRVYVSGDTGYGPHFADLGAGTGGVDLAVLYVGGYEPRSFNRHVHMSPEEAVRAATDLGAATTLVVAWGTYPLGLASGLETVRRVRAAADAAGLPPGAIVFLPVGGTLGF